MPSTSSNYALQSQALELDVRCVLEKRAAGFPSSIDTDERSAKGGGSGNMYGASGKPDQFAEVRDHEEEHR